LADVQSLQVLRIQVIFNVCYVNMGKPRLLMNTDVFFLENKIEEKNCN